MDALIQRFYDDVRRNLDDPASSDRFPASDRLKDFHDFDRRYFEELLLLSGDDNLIGYAETSFSLVSGQEFYLLPEGFRNFLALEKRDSSGYPLNRIGSKAFYREGPGFTILTSARSLRIFPAPTLTETEEWTLIYQRAPGFIHYARPTAITASSLTTGTPASDAGEVFLQDGYYDGMQVRIFKADKGALQERDIISSKVVDGQVVFNLRHAWNPLPMGEVWYELVASIPLQYDSIYGLDVATLQIGRRKQEPASMLIKHRDSLWHSINQWVLSNVSDRGATRLGPIEGQPTGDVEGNLFYGAGLGY